jgi:hypothetical protein
MLSRNLPDKYEFKLYGKIIILLSKPTNLFALKTQLTSALYYIITCMYTYTYNCCKVSTQVISSHGALAWT